MSSNILAPDTLSFLGVKPTTNWLDYFLDRHRFSKFLREEPVETHLVTIANEMIEQALNSEKEVMAMEKKQVDYPGANTLVYLICFLEDIIKIRHKVEELWMFACGCMASLNWDINLFLER